MRTRMYGGVRDRGLAAPSYSILEDDFYIDTDNHYQYNNFM